MALRSRWQVGLYGSRLHHAPSSILCDEYTKRWQGSFCVCYEIMAVRFIEWVVARV